MTMNGKVVSWVNNYNGGSPTPAPAPALPAPEAAGAADIATSAIPSPNPPSATPFNTSTITADTGNFTRQKYYDSKNTIAQNLIFLANNLWAENLAKQIDFHFS